MNDINQPIVICMLALIIAFIGGMNKSTVLSLIGMIAAAYGTFLLQEYMLEYHREMYLKYLKELTPSVGLLIIGIVDLLLTILTKVKWLVIIFMPTLTYGSYLFCKALERLS